jgi:MFS transporter, Spinster family, sphingosine-1-phosphate transporter
VTTAAEGTAPAERGSAELPPRSAWIALGVLTLINLFNYLDRFVVPAIQEQIKGEFHPSDFWLGALSGAFIIVYTAASPFFGAVGDRMRRTRLIALGVGIWSVATVTSGLAGSYWSLLASRAAVGIGEAAYGTLAPTLIADYFPARMRGRALAIFYAAMPLGGALGYLVGGAVASRFDWRTAFFVAGAPGFVLAVMSLWLPETVRRAGARVRDGIANYRALLKNPPFRRIVIGYVAQTFALGGLSVWMSSFLQREHGLTVRAADYQLGAITVIAGIPGALIGGWLGDRLLRWRPEAYLWVSGVSTILAFPLALLAITMRSDAYVYALFGAELLIFMSTGPVNSRALGVVPISMRAAAMAMSTFAIHAFGDAWSSPLIGWVSDLSNIRTAATLIPVALAVGGAVWLYAAWRGDREPATGALV